MTILKSKILLAALLAVAFDPLTIEASPYTISDDRIRSLDITPVLGRGYSIGTNTFQSTCLMVDAVTSPSYNYDYVFTDMTEDTESEAAMEGSVSGSFSYFFIKGSASISAKSSGKVTAKTRKLVATMRIERYYSSVREELSPLSEDALTLLDRQDYIGFFKSCGPNYIRSIRRAQELTAIFSFTSTSADVAASFVATVQASSPSTFFSSGGSGSSSVGASSKYSSVTSSMEITILGFGLGLNSEGSATMVAASLEEYQEVMKFGFKSFTQNEDSHNIGMVYGMEIVPWVDNTSFQVNSKLMDEAVIIPLPRSMIPRAYTNTSAAWANVEATRITFMCKESSFHKDRYGYCCEENVLWDTETQTYVTEEQNITVSLMTCRPARQLDKSVVKNNMSNNGEFVAHLDAIVRYKLNQLFTLEKCLTSVKALPTKYDFHILKTQDSVKYDGAIDRQFTLKEMKFALDPLNDYSMLNHVGQELDEFVEMYYQPCVAALFGMNIGTSPDTEPQYFMAYGWLSHSACTKLSCLADNMRWDRAVGQGCVPSLFVGGGAPVYETDADTYCKKDNTKGNDVEEVCKYLQDDYIELQEAANLCWNGDPTEGIHMPSPAYLLNYFCMPQITAVTATEDQKDRMDTYNDLCPGHALHPYDETL